MSRLLFRCTTAMVALAISALPALAQGGGGGGGAGGGARMQAALFNGITLSGAQQTKVDSIEGAYRASRGDMTPGPGMSADDRQKMRESRQREVADLRTVLTPDQQSAFDQNVANMRQMRSRGGGGSPQ